MDARTWILSALLLAGACGAVTPPPPRGAAVSDEARAREVLEELARYCAERGEECAAYFEPEIHPEIEVSEAVRRFVSTNRREVQSLGFALRWDSRTGRLAIERGGGLSYPANVDP